MLNSFFKLVSVLNIKNKRNLIFLFFIKIFSGLFDMIGVASLAPVILIITKNEILETNKYAIFIKEFTNFDNETLTIFFVLVSISLILLNITLRTISVVGDAYVSNNIWYHCVNKIYDFYLNRPYKYHLKNSSNDLMEKLVIRANDGIHQIIYSIYLILGSLFSLVFLISLLLFMNYKITLFMFFVVLIFYTFVYQKIKKIIDKFGKFIPEFSKKTFKIANQSFRSIKDIKIFNNQNFYTSKYSVLQKDYKNFSVKMSLVNSLPRSIFEIIIFSIIYSTILFLLLFQLSNLNDVILILGIFAVALQRMVPAAQSIFQGISNLKIANYSFNIIFPDLKEAVSEVNLYKKKTMDNYISFKNSITLNKLHFNYEKEGEKNLLEIDNLKIENKKIIGITGYSGAGKTTFIDIFCGLLEPKKGEFHIDDKLLNYNDYKKISSKIAYVSQFPFIADDSIENNIALGERSENINFERLRQSCEIVGLKAVIEKELENGYKTIIGEDGARLSGGQRQRICLARAIYRDKDILILDEATNSLDEKSEKNIMINLKKLFNNKLIIFITHRISTLDICNEILIFKKGKIIYQGEYKNIDSENLKVLDLIKNK
jgi:ATP-binding cassette, subfamily B, bacterial PglK